MQHCLSGPCVSFLVQCDLQGVLVIYCCITNYHKHGLKTTQIFFFFFGHAHGMQKFPGQGPRQ